jgi:hypothetical protein
MLVFGLTHPDWTGLAGITPDAVLCYTKGLVSTTWTMRGLFAHQKRAKCRLAEGWRPRFYVSGSFAILKKPTPYQVSIEWP